MKSRVDADCPGRRDPMRTAGQIRKQIPIAAAHANTIPFSRCLPVDPHFILISRCWRVECRPPATSSAYRALLPLLSTPLVSRSQQ